MFTVPPVPAWAGFSGYAVNAWRRCATDVACTARERLQRPLHADDVSPFALAARSGLELIAPPTLLDRWGRKCESQLCATRVPQCGTDGPRAQRIDWRPRSPWHDDPRRFFGNFPVPVQARVRKIIRGFFEASAIGDRGTWNRASSLWRGADRAGFHCCLRQPISPGNGNPQVIGRWTTFLGDLIAGIKAASRRMQG